MDSVSRADTMMKLILVPQRISDGLHLQRMSLTHSLYYWNCQSVLLDHGYVFTLDNCNYVLYGRILIGEV